MCVSVCECVCARADLSLLHPGRTTHYVPAQDAASLFIQDSFCAVSVRVFGEVVGRRVVPDAP